MPSSRPSPKPPEIVAMLQSKRRSSPSHLNPVRRRVGECSENRDWTARIPPPRRRAPVVPRRRLTYYTKRPGKINPRPRFAPKGRGMGGRGSRSALAELVCRTGPLGAVNIVVVAGNDPVLERPQVTAGALADEDGRRREPATSNTTSALRAKYPQP